MSRRGALMQSAAAMPMSPAPAGTAVQLRLLIHYHLDNGFVDNALMFASRLHALDPRSGDATHLLALCNYRLGRYKAAFEYAKPRGHQSPHLGCAYVFAQACLVLERYDAGAQALQKTRGLWSSRNHWNKHTDTTRRHLPDAAACSCLLGKLYSGYGDPNEAVRYYVEALKLNPFMWDAFTDLCNIADTVRPSLIFKLSPDILASLSRTMNNGHHATALATQDSFEGKNPFVSTPDADPFNTSGRPADNGLHMGGANLMSKLHGGPAGSNGNGPGASCIDMETPTSNGHKGREQDVPMGAVGGPVMLEQTTDITHAPSRRPRTQAISATEEPPRMRPITSRSRTKTVSEHNERTEIPQPQWQNGHKRTISGHATQHAQQVQAPQADPTAAPPRRSVRLLNSISGIRPSGGRLGAASSKDLEAKERRELRKAAKATGTKGRQGSTSTVGRVVSGNRKPNFETFDSLKPEPRPLSVASTTTLPPPKMVVQQQSAPNDLEALQWILALLQKLGSGYLHLNRFECAKALTVFDSVSIQQRETPWVLAQIGKSYYERSLFAEAASVFQRIREKTPSYMEDMEVYSNTLWQLKRDVDLAHLAHTLDEQDRLSPQAWCATGNSFSLQRNHDKAIECFVRATQLDPKFAYAFTLQGHEHVQNEEFDKATHALRCAISVDNRHFNGWYGLGQVYERLGKFDVAEKHFRKAFQINPSNPILAVRIGMVLERMKKVEAALMQYEAAIRLDPHSTLARFRRGSILLKIDSLDEALQELLWLKDAVPEDPQVHFLLGKIYKRMRNRQEAVRHLTIALNLDPKAQPVIKGVLEGDDEGEDGGGWESEEDG